MDNPEADTVVFDRVAPCGGFETVHSRLDRQDDAWKIWRRRLETGGFADAMRQSAVVARGACSIRLLDVEPYLQCELWFPASAGEMRVSCGGVLLDKAELAEGWQHSAVALAGLAKDSVLTLEFVATDGAPVEAVGFRIIGLSREWGRGIRRRLKCYLPFSMLGVFSDFSVHPCVCGHWMKDGQVLGNSKSEKLADLWNGEKLQAIRRNFLDGDYGANCREEICPYLTGEMKCVEPPVEAIRAVNEGETVLDYGLLGLQHDIDRGCNLDCIMCRDEKILPNPANVDQGLDDIRQAIDLGSLKIVTFSGAGEPFAMKRLVDLMATDAFSGAGIELGITTNLTYFNSRLLQKIGHNLFRNITVSADGASAEVYRAVRRGGSWATVERNMRLLSALRRDGKAANIVWNYTVLRQNVRDVANAIRLANELGFDTIRFIGQLGALSRTDGNMFEDYDLDALDALYAQFEQAGAFDDPMVMMSETAMRDRRYRTASFVLDLAQHVLDRHKSYGPARSAPPPADIVKCLALVDKVMSGTVDRSAGLTAHNIAFLRRLAGSGLGTPASMSGIAAQFGAWRRRGRLRGFAREMENAGRTQAAMV